MSLSSGIVNAGVVVGGGGYWVESEWFNVAWRGSWLGWRWCAEVGVREIGRWWEAGQCVNGVEGEACVLLCALQVVVVNGDDTLDGLWKGVSEWLMADGCFAKSCVGGKVLMKEKTVDMEVCQNSHQGMWRV